MCSVTWCKYGTLVRKSVHAQPEWWVACYLPAALFFSAAQIGVRCVLSLWESLGLGLGLNQDLFLKKSPNLCRIKKMTPPGSALHSSFWKGISVTVSGHYLWPLVTITKHMLFLAIWEWVSLQERMEKLAFCWKSCDITNIYTLLVENKSRFNFIWGGLRPPPVRQVLITSINASMSLSGLWPSLRIFYRNSRQYPVCREQN